MPTIATSKNVVTIFFGPKRSNINPKGICIAANPKKYPPASNPKLEAFRENSSVNTGDKVAVIALNRVDKKQPKAKTKNTPVIYFFDKIFFSMN